MMPWSIVGAVVGSALQQNAQLQNQQLQNAGMQMARQEHYANQLQGLGGLYGSQVQQAMQARRWTHACYSCGAPADGVQTCSYCRTMRE